MSVFPLTDIIPEQLPTDLIVSRQHPTKKAQKGGYPAAFLCVVVFVVKRSTLRLLALFYGYGYAWALLPLC